MFFAQKPWVSDRFFPDDNAEMLKMRLPVCFAEALEQITDEKEHLVILEFLTNLRCLQMDTLVIMSNQSKYFNTSRKMLRLFTSSVIIFPPR